MITDFEITKKMLAFEEGDKRFLYDDATSQRAFASDGNLTGGIGHNFDSAPLSDAVVDLLFHEDWSIALEACHDLFPNYNTLSQARRLALINMAFNMGEHHLATFKRMAQAIMDLDFEKAAQEALDSLWGIQCKSRAMRVSKMLRENIILSEYQNGMD